MHIRKRAALLAVSLTAGLLAGALSVSSARAAKAKTVKPQAVRVVIKDVPTSDGTGPALIGPGGVGAKSLFTAHAGRPVVLTIVNQSTTLHSFTSATLGVNSIIVVGATATVKFTPKKTGVFNWVCNPPCGTWVMSNDGYMKGTVKVAKS